MAIIHIFRFTVPITHIPFSFQVPYIPFISTHITWSIFKNSLPIASIPIWSQFSPYFIHSQAITFPCICVQYYIHSHAYIFIPFTHAFPIIYIHSYLFSPKCPCISCTHAVPVMYNPCNAYDRYTHTLNIISQSSTHVYISINIYIDIHTFQIPHKCISQINLVLPLYVHMLLRALVPLRTHSIWYAWQRLHVITHYIPFPYNHALYLALQAQHHLFLSFSIPFSCMHSTCYTYIPYARNHTLFTHFQQ